MQTISRISLSKKVIIFNYGAIQPCIRTDRGREGGRGGVVNQMWKGLDRGRGSQKFPNLCGHPLWMTPIGNNAQKICSKFSSVRIKTA